MTDPVRKPDGKVCGKKSAATLKPYAAPKPRAIRVNMFRWRVRSEFQQRTKNGQPAQRTTGVVKRNWIPWLRRGEIKCARCRPRMKCAIASRKTGVVRIVAIQKRRVMSLASEFSSFGSPVAATGSRVIPQIGQWPG